MKHPSRLFVSAILAAALVVIPFSSARADPTPPSLPLGSSLYTMSCDSYFINAQLGLIDPSSGDTTLVGDGIGNPDSTCARGSSYNANDSFAYASVFTDALSLFKIDPATGIYSDLGHFETDADPAVGIRIGSVAIDSAGNAFGNDADGNIYTIDLSNGIVAFVGSTNDSGLVAIAFRPVTNVLYGLDSTGKLLTINTNFETSVVASFDNVISSTWAFTIAANGIAWVENSGIGTSELWSFDLDAENISDTGVLSGLVRVEGVNFNQLALFIVPAPISPATAPAITSAANASAAVGEAFNFTVTATGTPAPTFTTSGTLPAGVTVDATTGVLSGTPRTGGIYTFTITATNTDSSADQAFTLAVIELPTVSG